MYLIMSVVTVAMVLLILLSRKEDDGRHGRTLVTHKAAMYLYKLVHRVGGKVTDEDQHEFMMPEDQISRNLKAMNIGASSEKLRREYFVDKIEMTMLVILAGTFLAACVHFADSAENAVQNGKIAREDRFQADKEVELVTEVDGRQEAFALVIHSQEINEDELQEIEAEFEYELESLILGDNESLEVVVSDLDLKREYRGYPFEVTWSTDREDCLNARGEVETGDIETEVSITAKIRYEDHLWVKNFQAILKPKVYSERDLLIRDIQKSLEESEMSSRLEASWKIPEVVDGMKLSWSEKRRDWSRVIFILGVLAAVAIYFAADRDLRVSVEQRRESMKREYPRLVQLLTLYVGAGMTVRGAINRITAEYEDDNPIYQELKLTCKEMQGGISEIEAYERFGHRTGVREYVQLSMLLNINLRRGSYDLVDRLTEEALRAQNDRLQSSRRMGEELSSKLLVPLMMYLGIVMIIIIIPAFSSI